MKYEAKYVYTYMLDKDKPGLKNENEFLPFLYDSREQTEANQYIECGYCGAKFPCYYTQAENGLDFSAGPKTYDAGGSMKVSTGQDISD